MPDTKIKISELPATSTVNVFDELVVNQGGETKRVAVSNLPGLSASLVSFQFSATTPSFSYTVPAGKSIFGFAVGSTSAQTFNVGTTVGGSNILANAVLSANAGGLFDWKEFCFEAKTFYFSNLTGTVTLVFYVL